MTRPAGIDRPMTTSPVYLTAPRYVLGEIEEDHTAVPNLAERLARFRIAPRAEFWGWGRMRRTEQGIAAMAVESGSATLQAARIDPASLDALVLCSTVFPEGTGNHGSFVQEVLTGLDIEEIDFFGAALNSCANLLGGLQVADAMVASGRYRRVLVITTDRITDESQRMEKFALFSDGAASCLVTADHGSYELVSCAAAHSVRDLDWSSEISPDLARRVNERLLKPAGLRLEDVAGLMHTNIFKPVIVMKEMQAGFARDQLFTDNIARVGHCFAADPIINLVDREAAGHIHDDRYYMLAASVPGLRIGALLRKVPEVP